jgi:hypothetical protein
LSGKTLATASAICFLAGRHNRREGLNLTNKVLQQFGVDRHAKRRALVALEKAGLIQVTRQPRKNPLIAIVELDSPAKAGV